MACILQCARPLPPRRSTSSSRTSPKFPSCSTSTNWPQYHLRRPTFLYPQPPTTTSRLLWPIRIPPFSRESSFELIGSLPSTSTSHTTYIDLDEFYKTYDFGSDVSTSMACSVTSTSDFFQKLTYTHGVIRSNGCGKKTTTAFYWVSTFCPGPPFLLSPTVGPSGLRIFLYLLSRLLLVFSVFKLCSWIFPPFPSSSVYSLPTPCHTGPMGDHAHVLQLHPDVAEQQDLLALLQAPTRPAPTAHSAPRGTSGHQPPWWNSPTRHVMAIINFQDLADLSTRLSSSPDNIDSWTLNAGLTWELLMRSPLFTWCRHFEPNELSHVSIRNLCQQISTRIPRHLEHSNPGTHLGTSRLRWRRRNCSDCGWTEHRGSTGRLVSSLANDSTGHFPTWTTPTQSTQTVRVAHLMPSKSPRSHLAVTPMWPSWREKLSAASGSTRHVDFLWFFLLMFFPYGFEPPFAFVVWYPSSGTFSAFLELRLWVTNVTQPWRDFSWPPSERTTSNPRPTGSTDSDMIDDIGHESFCPPSSPQHCPLLFLRFPLTIPNIHHLPLTIITQTTFLMDHGHQALHPGGNSLPLLTSGNVRYTPSSSRFGTRIAHLAPSTLRRSTNKELFANLIRSISFTSLQVIMYKPTRCQTIGVLIMAYLCNHGGTPHHPTWASSTSPTTPSTIPAAAKHLATLLFGAQAAERLTAPGAPAVDHSPWHQCGWPSGGTWPLSRPTSSPRDLPSRTEHSWLTRLYKVSRLRLYFGPFAQLHIRKIPAWRGVCVCVWNIWIDVKTSHRSYQSRGMERTYESIWGSIQRSSSYDPRISLGTLSDVPAIFEFSVKWQPAKPITGHLEFVAARLSQSDDYFVTGHLDDYLRFSVHFRMLNSGCIIPIWTLFRLSYLHRGHPEKYVAEDSLLS